VETIDPVAHDFILYCIQRRGKAWPALYDEMCWVAGHRLFRGLGSAELKSRGVSLSLSHVADIVSVIDTIAAEEAAAHSRPR
jgi:hypothetical protein